MTFYMDNTTDEEKRYYEQLLQVTGSLSKLFSENTKPYLASRLTENLFCRCLRAENLSRSDITADAKKNGIGIGIKTWIGNSSQKIAEFNAERPNYENLNAEEKIKYISQLRNERISFTLRTQGLSKMIYHCTLRDDGMIKIAECPLVPIDIENIQGIKATDSSISFNDGLNQYKFNLSKSTLYKKFDDLTVLKTIPVEIIKNPYDLLCDLLTGKNVAEFNEDSDLLIERAYLPLYTPKGKERIKVIPDKNNVNIRFAGGRKRDLYEVGLPIPAEFRKQHPDFFLGVGTSFKLILPDGKEIIAKQCQQDGKSLMSNPNKALGHWLIDDVLQIDPRKPITLDMLEKYGVDSVEISKFKNKSNNEIFFKINFATIDSYEKYMGYGLETDEQ